MSFLTPSRTLLLISDDSLFIFAVGPKGAVLVENVPWSAENFEDEVSLIITKECGGKPVLIVHDMVEQHYRKEKIPHVGFFDKQNVIDRKLHAAFSTYAVRAAFPLKGGGGGSLKTDTGLGGDPYIFAAVSAGDVFEKTLLAVTRSFVPIVGFVLLPIESSDMVRRLAEKIAEKRPKDKEIQKARWTLFIGQNRDGGLRQIVIKDGDMALTRMTPIVSYESNSELWVGEVHQEFKATMSYLSRFGFDSQDGLDVILISEPQAGEKLEGMLDVPCFFHSISALQAAEMLRINIGEQDNYYLSDALHVSWIGTKNRFALPMKAVQIDSVLKPRRIVALFIVLLLLGGGGQSYQFTKMYQEFREGWQNLEDAQARREQLDLQYEKELKNKSDVGVDILLMQSSLTIYDDMMKWKIPAIPLLKAIGKALENDMYLDQIQMACGKNLAAEAVKAMNRRGGASLHGEGNKKTAFWLRMQMTYPSFMNAQKGNRDVNAFRDRLQKLLPDYVVSVTKLLEDYEYNEGIVLKTGSAEEKSVKQDYVAEVKIEGFVVDEDI